MVLLPLQLLLLVGSRTALACSLQFGRILSRLFLGPRVDVVVDLGSARSESLGSNLLSFCLLVPLPALGLLKSDQVGRRGDRDGALGASEEVCNS